MHLTAHWHVSRLRVRRFKSFGSEWADIALPSPHLVGLTGANGTGKSNLLEAMMFAAGAQAVDLRARTLRDLCNADFKQLCEVEVEISQYKPGQQQSLAWQNGKSKLNKRGVPGHGESHWVRAALTPDGTRTFQLDGRSKTAQQIKDTLRSLGIHLDAGMSVIRQAAVTQLADRNTPAAVTAVIAAASGLARWNDETSRADAELQAARKALEVINTNLQHLCVLIKADSSRTKQAAVAQQLELQVSLTATRLAAAYATQQEATTMTLMGAQAEIANAEDDLDMLKAQIADVDVQLAKIQEQQRLSEGHNQQSVILQQVKQVAAAEGQVQAAAALLQEARTGQQRHARLTAELSAVQLKESTLQAALHDAEAQLQSLQATHNVSIGLEDASQDPTAYLESLQAQVNSSSTHAKQLEHQQAQRTTELHTAQHQLNTCKLDLKSVMHQHAELERAAQAHAGSGDYQEQVRLEEEHLQEAHNQLSISTVRLRVLQTQLGLRPHIAVTKSQSQPHHTSKLQQGAEAASKTQAITACQLPARLHTLFAFKEQCIGGCKAASQPAMQHGVTRPNVPVSQLLASKVMPSKIACQSRDRDQNLQQRTPAEFWCRALSVIVGGSLDVMVVSDAAQASHVLQDITQAVQSYGPAVCHRAVSGRMPHQAGKHGAVGDTVRIWPLDRITVVDRAAAQQAAQAALGPGRVVLPLDLLDYPPQLHSAMLRAFGGYVLASDSATAAQLAQQYGLAAVTPDGTISRRGSVSGGYLGPASGAPGRPVSGPEAVLAAKIELQEAKAEYEVLSDQVGRTRSALQVLHKQSKEAEQMAAALRVSSVQLADKQLAVEAAQGHVSACQAAVEMIAAQHTTASQAVQSWMSALATARTQLSGSSNHNAAILQLKRQQLQQGQQQVQQLQDEHAEVLQQLQQLQAEVDLSLALRETLPLSANECVLELDEQSSDTAAAAGGIQQDWGVAKLERAHDEATEKLEEAQEQLRQGRQAAKEAGRAEKERQKQMQQLQVKQRDLQHNIQARKQQLSQQQQHRKALEEALVQLAANSARLAKEHGVHLRSAKGTGNLQQAPATTDKSDHTAESHVTSDVTHLHSQIHQLVARRQAIGQVKGLSTTEQMHSKARVDEMQLFEQRAATLAAGIASLQEAMCASQQQVLSTHSTVYTAIRARFQQLCAQLLPSMQFTLGSAGEQPASKACAGANCAPDSSKRKHTDNIQQDSQHKDGKQQLVPATEAAGANHVMLFKRVPVGGAAAQASTKDDDCIGGEGDGWLSSLEQLSGGQRTLVSLALLLAAAWEGSRSSVLLLDEVDAALDEANQYAVAQLLSHLAHGTLDAAAGTDGHGSSKAHGGVGRSISGVQVVCVSHQPAFQKACDALVQVSRQASGTLAAASATAATSKAVDVDRRGAADLALAAGAPDATAQGLHGATSSNTRKRNAKGR